MVCVMLVIPVMAASSFFRKSTTKLNAFNGGTSSISTFTSGSVFGSDPTISDIRLSLNVSRGTVHIHFISKVLKEHLFLLMVLHQALVFIRMLFKEKILLVLGVYIFKIQVYQQMEM